MDATSSNLPWPDDPQVLKRLLLEQQAHIADLEQQRLTWQQKQIELELEKLRLEHRLAVLLKRYYGPRSEKVDLGQLLLEFAQHLEARPLPAEDLPPENSSPEAPRRLRRGRRNLAAFDHLPTLRQVHDLPDPEKPCPCCGQERVKIGEETTWQVEYVPGHFQRIEHVQIKYACRQCEQEARPPQITLAEKPLQPIDKGLPGPGLLAYVVTAKFADYMPLYRLENIFARNGFEISRATLCLWAADVADLIEPLYRRMVERVLQSHVIATDDTVLPMLAAEKCRQARLWIYLGDDDQPYNVFDFTASRSRDGPAKFLGDYSGVLLADAYGGYDGICLEKAITQAGCWAHARRKFVDCQSLLTQVTGPALKLIGQLFQIEEQAKKLSGAERLALRQRESVPLLDELRQGLVTWQGQLLPKHPVAGAIGYILNQWGPLTAHTRDGAVAIHNNLAEQQMKRIALNRKNSLFVGNERGGRTAAILSSITSTCRRHDIDPQRYLTQLLTNLPATPLSQLDHWLPDAWLRQQVALDASPQ